MSKRINLGDMVRDVYTKFSGIVGARIEFLHGCSRILIEPTKLDKDGKVQESQYFDEQRVKLVKRMEIKDETKKKVARGGPRDAPARRVGPRR